MNPRGWLVGFCAAAGMMACAKYEDGTVSGLFAYDRVELVRGTSLEREPEVLRAVDRNGTGTMLYLYTPKSVVLIRRGTSPAQAATTGALTFLGDAGTPVAWSDDLATDGLRFSNGATVKVRPFGRVGVDPSGRYYFAEVDGGLTQIGRVERPTAHLLKSKRRGHRIFANGAKVYFFGEEAAEGTVGSLTCEVLGTEGEALHRVREVRIPVPKRGRNLQLLDFDEGSGRGLLRSPCDLPCQSRWLLFDMKDQKLVDIGVARDFGFFLREDVLDRRQSSR